jgi:GTPase SAR1 family protein
MNLKMENQKAQEIENYLNTLSSLSSVKLNKSLIKRVSVLQDKLKNKTFQLVILGQFKRGKTSLINSLFGENLLPTAIVPLTSVITIIKYGRKEKIIVSFLDGQKKEISRYSLCDYITELKNPMNKKGVDQVTFEYPSAYLKSGVQIIDTPGVGSVYRHNTDVAYQFVPKADAGIFVVTADPPISNSELLFLKSIKDYLAKIVFVQNKIDQVEEKDRLESLEFTKKVIEETVGKKGLKFYQVSAKLGLEGKKENNKFKLDKSQILTFQENLNKLLIQRKEQVLLLSIIYKLLPLINEVELGLQIEKQALQLSVDELKRKIELFNKEAEKINQEKEDNSYILQGQAERLVNQVLIDDIEILKEKTMPRLSLLFEKFFKKNQHLGGRELSKQFDVFLEKTIKNIFNSWRKEEEKKLQDSLKSIISRFSDQTNQYIRKIIELSGNLFKLKLQKFQLDSTLAEEVDFKFSFDEYKVDIDFYTPLVTRLPKFISSKLLYSKMKDNVFQQFDRHCGRSRYDFHERLMKSLYEYTAKLDELLKDTIKGIENALVKAQSEKERKEEYQNKLKAQILKQEKKLSEIRRKIEKIIPQLSAEN